MRGAPIKVIVYCGSDPLEATMLFDTYQTILLSGKKTSFAGFPGKVWLTKVESDFDVFFKDGCKHMVTATLMYD